MIVVAPSCPMHMTWSLNPVRAELVQQFSGTGPRCAQDGRGIARRLDSLSFGLELPRPR
jgi:hypothetical protein